MRFPELHPIFRREVLAYLRAPWMRWAAVACLLVPFIAIALQWPRGTVYFGGGRQSAAVVGSYFRCVLVLASIVFPTMGAYAVATERQNRTYDFLFTTAMPSWSIGLAKLAAIAVAGLVLMAASLPALSITFVLGGVEGGELSTLALLTLVCPLICGGIALLFSIVMRSGHAALAMSALVSIPFYLTAWSHLSGQLRAITWLQQRNLTVSVALPPAMHWGIVLFLLAISAIVLLAILALTRYPPEEGRRTAGRPIDDPSELSARRRRWPYYVVDPAKRPDPIADGANPLMMKERLGNLLFRSAWRWRGFYVAIALLLAAFAFTTARVGVWVPDLGVVFKPLWVAATLGASIWAALATAVTFAAEHEARTIEAFKLTRLSPWQFLRAKWRVCWRLRWPYTALALALFLTVLFSDDGWYHIVSAPHMALLTATVIEVSALTAAWAALRTKSVGRAIMLTVAVMTVVVWGADFAFNATLGIMGDYLRVGGAWVVGSYSSAYWRFGKPHPIFGGVLNYGHWMLAALGAWGLYCGGKLLRQCGRLWTAED